ncbi:hypothetical protein BS47DRAFT_1399431 [Hydnum rufescens UP504]|uniref:DH domain-containing protein n=1 Tax=Hydnum rufescens UP504 TaxID=1448309 RepID=A0A9P6AKH1_9AGAM|nr:hypothetical protein BS47DRAFT_1399431 [Hydnum rufescens UP504]
MLEVVEDQPRGAAARNPPVETLVLLSSSTQDILQSSLDLPTLFCTRLVADFRNLDSGTRIQLREKGRQSVFLQTSSDPIFATSKPRIFDDTYMSAFKRYLSHSVATTTPHAPSSIPHLIPSLTSPPATISSIIPIETSALSVPVPQIKSPGCASTHDAHLYAGPRSRDLIPVSNMAKDNGMEFSHSPTILVSGSPIPSPHDSSTSETNAVLSTSPSTSLRSHSSGDYVTTSPHSQLTLTEPAGTIRTKRWYALAEIVESERMYVNDLRILVHIYIHSLMTNLSLPLTSEQRKLVALNVDQLLQVHEPFAADLEKAVEDYGISYGVNQKEMIYDPDDEPKFEWAAVNAVSECFLNLAPRLEVYQTYCSGHTEAVDILRGIQSRPEYVAFEKACALSVSGALAENTPSPTTSAPHEDFDVPNDKSPSSSTVPHSPEDAEKTFSPPATSAVPQSLYSAKVCFFPQSIPFPSLDHAIAAVAGIDDIPPVPPIAPLMTTLSWASKAGKLLEFRDLLIKPIQRQNILEQALMAIKKVAKDVDDARERQDAIVKNRLILDRFEIHPSITLDFLRSLGECKLACALDVIYHHPVYAPLTTPIKVKYYGAFVYNGYMFLVKVRKSKTYQPQHWFALESIKIKDLERDDAWLSHSFRLSLGEHHFEYGASCVAEKEIWIRCLANALGSTGPLDCPESSLQLIEARHTISQAQAVDEPSSTARKRRGSIISSTFASSGPNSSPWASTGLKDDNAHSQALSEGELLASKIRRPSLMRVSTVNLTSIFTSDPMALTLRRSTPQSRTNIDRNLVDVSSNVCLTARMQAQLSGELFQPFRPSISALHPPNTPKSWMFGSSTSPRRNLPMGKPDPNDRMPSHLERPERTSTTVSAHRKSRSLPKNPTPRDLTPLIIDHTNSAAFPGPPSGPLHQRRHSNETPPLSTTSPHDNSDDECVGSIWDDVLSSAHTDLTSEDVHMPVGSRIDLIAGLGKAVPSCSMTVPRVEEEITLEMLV